MQLKILVRRLLNRFTMTYLSPTHKHAFRLPFYRLKPTGTAFKAMERFIKSTPFDASLENIFGNFVLCLNRRVTSGVSGSSWFLCIRESPPLGEILNCGRDPSAVGEILRLWERYFSCRRDPLAVGEILQHLITPSCLLAHQND